MEGVESNSPPFSPEEKHFLVRNAFQYHYTNRGGLSKEAEEIAIDAKGEDIRSWFSTPEGRSVIAEYASSHTETEIEEGKDLDFLIQRFELFKPDTLH